MHLQKPMHWGSRQITRAALLATAVIGLVLVKAQIEVFDLTPHWPNARTLPFVWLSLLAGALALRMVLVRKCADPVSESDVRFAKLRWLALTGGMALGIAMMEKLGFVPGFLFIGCIAAGVMARQHRLRYVVATVVFTGVVYAAAVYVLHIPLR